MQAIVERMARARTRGQHRAASEALVQEVREGLQRSRGARPREAQEAHRHEAREAEQAGNAQDARKADADKEERALETTCPVCLVEGSARCPCGSLKGLGCVNGHAVCIDCARKLVEPCAPGCSCPMRLNYKCPICRSPCSISPYHAMVLIKGSHDEANKTLERAFAPAGLAAYMRNGGRSNRSNPVDSDDDVNPDDSNDNESVSEYDEESDTDFDETEAIPMDQETFNSVRSAIQQAGANVEFVVRRSRRNAAQ